MKQVRDDNYFVVFGWMRALGLKGLQLELYAIIYGFSQDSAGAFYGTLSYLEELTGFNKRTIINNCLDITGCSLEGKRKAADILEISESTLYRKLRILGIKR